MDRIEHAREKMKMQASTPHYLQQKGNKKE